MATEKDRITVTHDDDMRDRVEYVKDVEGFEHDAEVGRELLRRGLDDWEREKATYPGSQFVQQAIEVSSVGFIVGVVVSMITTNGLAFESAVALGGVVVVFVSVHYAALIAEGQPSAEPDDVRDVGGD